MLPRVFSCYKYGQRNYHFPFTPIKAEMLIKRNNWKTTNNAHVGIWNKPKTTKIDDLVDVECMMKKYIYRY